MAGSSPREAIGAFLAPLRRSLLCVTHQVVLHRGGYHVGAQHRITLGDPEPARLRGTDVGLSVVVHYRTVDAGGERDPYRISTSAYYYAIHDANGRDILAFHWHPQSSTAYPHLQVGAGAESARAEFHKAHVPTGKVPLQAVLRLLIQGFGAEPLRPAWESDLDEAQQAFETQVIWG